MAPRKRKASNTPEAVEAVEVKYEVVCKNLLNIRKVPDGEVDHTVPNGTILTGTGDISDGYTIVICNGKVMYAKSEFLRKI